MRLFRYLSLVLMLCISCFVLTACGDLKDYKAEVAEGDVVKLTLFTYDGKGESHFGLMNLGHTFLSFENISGETMTIGGMEVVSGETIAVGTWSVASHFGIWYNLEGNYIDEHDKYNGRVSVTIGLNSEDMIKVNDFIKENDRWNPLKNCSFFALNLYNLVASETESIPTPLIYTPTYIAKHIKAFDSYETNKPLVCEDKFGYYDGETYVEYSFSEVKNESV
ncbi:MAG: hypothetical protein E7354_03815 [Clostridiales bacterium]|nr:hypothetical protein [Clostridiales bacterium]